MEITRKNQVWVTDITYVRTKNSFAYVALITNVYSRKIVGAFASNTLELVGCKMALKQALRDGAPEFHHSKEEVNIAHMNTPKCSKNMMLK